MLLHAIGRKSHWSFFLLFFLGVVVIVIVVVIAEGTSHEKETKKKKVVLLLTDDQDLLYDLKEMYILCWLLARQGTLFENAFVTTPILCPSWTSFHSGWYAHNGGCGCQRRAEQLRWYGLGDVGQDGHDRHLGAPRGISDRIRGEVHEHVQKILWQRQWELATPQHDVHTHPFGMGNVAGPHCRYPCVLLRPHARIGRRRMVRLEGRSQ